MKNYKKLRADLLNFVNSQECKQLGNSYINTLFEALDLLIQRYETFQKRGIREEDPKKVDKLVQFCSNVLNSDSFKKVIPNSISIPCKEFILDVEKIMYKSSNKHQKHFADGVVTIKAGWTGMIQKLKRTGFAATALVLAGCSPANTILPIGSIGNITVTADDASETKENNAKEKKKNSQKKKGLSKTEISNEYSDLIIGATDAIQKGRPNGINVSAHEMVDVGIIANIDNWKEKDAKIAASALHPLTLEQYLAYFNALSDDMYDVTLNTIPLDATKIFTNQQSAQNINKIIEFFAKQNENPNNKQNREEFKNYILQYAKDFDKKLENGDMRNTAEAVAVLMLASTSSVIGNSFYTGENDAELDALFYGTNCTLSRAQKDLQEKLYVDFALAGDKNAKEVEDSIKNPTNLLEDKYAKEYNKDKNQASQLQYVANFNELSDSQLTKLASELQLNGATNHFYDFTDNLAKAIVSSNADFSKFDAKNTIFYNDEDAKIMNEFVHKAQSYKVAQGSEKENLQKELNEMFEDYITDVNSRRDKNNALTYFIASLATEAKENNSFSLDQDIEKILFNNPNQANCLMGDLEYMNDGVVASKTLKQQAKDLIDNTMQHIEIRDLQEINKDAQNSIYQAAVMKYRKEVSGYTENLHSVVIDIVKSKIKDIRYIPNAERDVAPSSLGSDLSSLGVQMDTQSENILTASDYTYEEPIVTVSGGGSEERDPELELWTDEQIEAVEEEASKEAGEIESQETIYLPSDEQVVVEEETEVTESEEKDENEDQNGDKVDFEDEVSLSLEDQKAIVALQQKLDTKLVKLEIQLQNGEITEDEYNRLVDKAYREFDEAVAAIYAKYNGKVPPFEVNIPNYPDRPGISSEDDKDEEEEKDKENQDEEDKDKDSEESKEDGHYNGEPVQEEGLEDYVWYKDADGDWIIITKEEYDQMLNDKNEENKEEDHYNGEAVQEEGFESCVWYKDADGDWIIITKEEYDQIVNGEYNLSNNQTSAEIDAQSNVEDIALEQEEIPEEKVEDIALEQEETPEEKVEDIALEQEETPEEKVEDIALEQEEIPEEKVEDAALNQEETIADQKAILSSVRERLEAQKSMQELLEKYQMSEEETSKTL